MAASRNGLEKVKRRDEARDSLLSHGKLNYSSLHRWLDKKGRLRSSPVIITVQLSFTTRRWVRFRSWTSVIKHLASLARHFRTTLSAEVKTEARAGSAISFRNLVTRASSIGPSDTLYLYIVHSVNSIDSQVPLTQTFAM